MRLIRRSMILVSLLTFTACASPQTKTAKPTTPAKEPVKEQAKEQAKEPLKEPAGGWQKIKPVGVDGLGNFVNDPNLIINGKFAMNHSVWNGAGCVWWTAVQAHLVVDLGKVCTVAGLVIQLATNNDYVISYSVTGNSYQNLMDIKKGDFESRWGMETLSTVQGQPGFFPKLSFQPIVARYLMISAVGGVYYQFAASEIEVLGACE